VEQGTAEVTASLDGVTSNTVQVTVTDAVLTAIAITPSSVSVGKGQTQQLTATATYSDNTTADVTGSVAWLSDDTATATVISGLLTGVEEGTTEISASLDGVTSDRVTVNVVVNPLFGEFEDISVNDFTFAVDAGFPTTGFHGAEFTLNTPSAPSDYTWSSDAPWVSVDSSGTVSFISQGDAAPVTITATPISGGEPLAYTFAVTHWFHSNENNRTTSNESISWCRELLPRITWKIPESNLLNIYPNSRNIGSLWQEWGALRLYSNSTFATGVWPYWAYRPNTTQSFYAIRVGDNGIINSLPSSGPNGSTYLAVCVLKL
ncbi:Ig-like domain-containing protein, partial [Aeromonas caviae]|uniref:Ig-like domain-containing protein n=1 Tax=Aeromonas caviae TaxID=648 RepID=UPI002B4A49B0